MLLLQRAGLFECLTFLPRPHCACATQADASDPSAGDSKQLRLLRLEPIGMDAQGSLYFFLSRKMEDCWLYRKKPGGLTRRGAGSKRRAAPFTAAWPSHPSTRLGHPFRGCSLGERVAGRRCRGNLGDGVYHAGGAAGFCA